jgi:hypothetical protein
VQKELGKPWLAAIQPIEYPYGVEKKGDYEIGSCMAPWLPILRDGSGIESVRGFVVAPYKEHTLTLSQLRAIFLEPRKFFDVIGTCSVFSDTFSSGISKSWRGEQTWDSNATGKIDIPFEIRAADASEQALLGRVVGQVTNLNPESLFPTLKGSLSSSVGSASPVSVEKSGTRFSEKVYSASYGNPKVSKRASVSCESSPVYREETR